MGATARKPTNLTLDTRLVEEARALKLNISQEAERGIAEAVKRERERQWQEENAEAIRSSNEWVAKHGLPLAKYRAF